MPLGPGPDVGRHVVMNSTVLRFSFSTNRPVSWRGFSQRPRRVDTGSALQIDRADYL